MTDQIIKKQKIFEKQFFFPVLPPQVFEEDLHCILVGFGQLLDQVFDHVHSLFVVRTFCKQRQRCLLHTGIWRRCVANSGLTPQLLTDGVDEVVEGAIGEERLWKLSEKHLQGSCGDVDVLPLTVIQVQLLIW